MAIRKYAGDYRLEYYLTADGREHPRRVYRGTYYVFAEDPGRVRRFIVAGVVGIGALLQPLLWSNSSLGRTLSVLLPAGLAVMPLYLLLAAALRMGVGQVPFTREHRDKTQGRFRGASIWLFLLLSAACVGCWAEGVFYEDAVPAVCLHLSLLPAGFLLTQRNKVKTVEAQGQKKAFQEENHENT